MKLIGYYTSFFLCIITNVRCYFEPKTYVFYEEETDWYNAYNTCRSNGATLPTFGYISDVMDVTDQVKQARNISVWIGLTWNETHWVTTEDSDNGQSSTNNSFCASMRLNSNSRPIESPCGSKKAFLCLYPAGYCRYRKYPQTSIVGYNTFTVLSVSLQYCQQICDQTTEFTCLSFEYNEASRYCQISDTNRWLVPLSFAYDVISWNYYHRTCVWAFDRENTVLHTSTTLSPTTTMSTWATTTSLNGKDTSKARKYILYDIQKSWREAKDYCSVAGGILATLNDESVLPESGLIDINPSTNKVWIGLTRLGTREWHWLSGAKLEWTKWKYVPNEIDLTESCGTVLLNTQGWWYPVHCGAKHSFICQFNSDSCRYEMIENAALIMHNTKVLNEVSVEECKRECDSSIDILCKSFEFNIHTNSCQLSDKNRWTAANFLRTDMTGWNYYHKRCNFGPFDLETTESSIASTTEATSFSTDSDSTQMVSTQPITTDDTESQSSTQVFEEEFQRMKEELEDIGRTIRSKNLQRARTSTWDSRPSATSVGVVATAILVSFLSVIVILDLATICQHCKNMHPKRFKKSRVKKYMYNDKYANDSLDNTMSVNQNSNLDEIKTEHISSVMDTDIVKCTDITVEAPVPVNETETNEIQESKL